MAREPTNLDQVLERVEKAPERGEKVTLGAILHSVGDRSFGPLLLVAGLLAVSPLSGIPGMPTAMGVLVLLVSLQLLSGRRQFWLPGWLVRRSISKNRLDRAISWLHPAARFFDRPLRRRLRPLVQGPSLYCIGAISALIGAAMPLMEFVPFSATIAGVVFAIFGLALIARDGLLALAGYGFTAAIVGLVGARLVN
jgi:hypothetical protein